MISRARLGRIVFEHLAASGVPVESPSSGRVPTTFDDVHALGSLLARVHAALDDLVLTGEDDPAVWTLTPSMLVGATDGWLRRGLHGLDDELSVVVPWRAAALERLPAGAAEGLCHGEVYPAACRNTAGGELAVSELDWVAPGWREYDLATTRWVLEVHAPDRAPDLFDDFVRGYETHGPAPITDALRAWVAARHLWSLRLGIGFEGPRQLHERADFARAWPLD